MNVKKRSFYELEKENIPQNVPKKRKKFDKILIPKIKPNFLNDDDDDEILPSPFQNISPGVFCNDANDFETKEILPCLTEKHNPDCASISPETMIKLLRGEITNRKFIIIDCRFPYEFEAGHIKNAKNIFTPEMLEEFLIKKPIENVLIIFHCEYSQMRAPKMYRFLREIDRKIHEHSYPKLYYPNLYILEGGYREFYKYEGAKVILFFIFKIQEFCEPIGYREMIDPQFKEECKFWWRRYKNCWSKDRRKNLKKENNEDSCSRILF